MSALSLDDPEMIRQFTERYLQSKPVEVQTQDEAGDETKGENEEDINGSSDSPSEDRDHSFEDNVEPSVSSGHDQAEDFDHANHHSQHTSEKSDYGDQQSDRTALSNHSSRQSALPDQLSDRNALFEQVDGQSDGSDEQFDLADEESDHADSQSIHTFQQSNHRSEQLDQADEQPNHTYQQSTHAIEKSDHADPPYDHTDLDSETSSRIKHQATQTEPVNIYSPQITKMLHSKTQAKSPNSSATGSPSATLSEAVASQPSDMKGKSAIDSVLLMSPTLTGILPPPSTPEAQPDLTNVGISKLIISELEGIKPLSMGESRHAPRASGSHSQYQPFRMTSKSTESVTGSSWPSPSLGKPSDLGSGPPEIPSPFTMTVADDGDDSKLSSLPDSTEISRWYTPSPFKPDSGATALATTSPPTKNAINDDERSSNGNSVESDSAKHKPADDKSIDDKFVDHETINDESVNGNSRERKSAENDFIDSSSIDTSGAIGKSAYGKSANKKSVGDGVARKGAHLPPHLRHLENSVQGSYEDQSREGKSTDQSDIAEATQQDQSDASPTSGRSGKKPNFEISTSNPLHPSADGAVEFDLTPSSVIFHAVSPPPTACLGNEDRTEQRYFDRWGEPVARTSAGMFLRLLLSGDYETKVLQPPKSAR